ncbi:MAG: ankyrin repeat domain-containing protein, partial [Spirochaetaceae bacterium]|nr:ankyrin repeat domain-containing protein [Spirochaetaceae bacterium]
YFLQRGASSQVKDASGATPLHEAVRYGYPDIVRILLLAGADPNTKDVSGNTPLLLVIPHAARDEIFNLLLAGNADPNAKDIYGDTPLHIATMVGTDSTIITKLIAAGADSNERNKKGETPLALAIDRRWTAQVSYYISRGSDIHAEDIGGNTPLSRALRAGMEILSIVITPETVSSRDSFGNTPLHVSVIRKAPPSLIQFLLKNNTDVNARNRSGETPLYMAVSTNQRQTGELLLAHKADVFSTNVDDDSPLRLALTKGGEIQDWILTSEVIKTTDGIGNTPLHYAAEWRLDNAVGYILEKGGNANARNANGETPLFNAVKADSASTVRLLITKGTQKDARDYLGNTALHACVRWSSTEAAAALIRSGADINAQNISGKSVLSEAARAGKTNMVSMLLDSKADINAADATGKTVLIDAIHGGKIEIVRLLLERGASPSIQEMYGRNAYHVAAETGNLALITMIKNAGGNPLSRDSYGRTPFSLVLDQSPTVIKTILGSDIQLIDSDGNTPIHIAISDRGSTETLQMLLGLGYPINRRNSAGVTPLLLAVRGNLLEHTKILLGAGADPYMTDNEGASALTLAFQQPEILTAIVQTNASKTDIAGEGILHYAAMYADVETMKRLLAMGLDRSSRSIAGETPYNVAVRWQRTEIADMLK